MLRRKAMLKPRLPLRYRVICKVFQDHGIICNMLRTAIVRKILSYDRVKSPVINIRL